MNPNKLLRVLGYNNLSIILMQERRHWLMKTSANNQIQDKYTGNIYQGRVDNTGSDIIIESKKLPYKYDYTADIKFGLIHADDVLDIYLSALPHSASVNGLMYTRITSTRYEYDDDKFGNYKIKFENAEECIIPFATSGSSSDVYAGKWLRTTTPPKMMVMNSVTRRFDITRVLTFDNSVTNPVWYYPLEESLQPFEIVDHTGNTYELAGVDDDKFIGDPLFWFTCDQSNVGSNITFDSSNRGSNDTQIIFIANEGTSTPYNAKLYVGIDGVNDATPDGSALSNYTIKVSPKSGEFSNSSADFSKPLSNIIIFDNTSTSTPYNITLGCNDNDKIFMCNDSENWTYVDSTTYEISMDYFEINNLHDHPDNALTAFLSVSFDPAVPFVQETKEYGYAGMRFYAGNPAADTVERYPYNLNKWGGLPDWLSGEILGANPVQEHGIVYAMHNSRTSDPEDPETSQGSGLIFDPGLVPTPGSSDNSESIGRVYVLSNDDTEYHNNADNESELFYPKPARTAARICDIPTSAVQLTGAKGLSSTQVVDRKYVRTQTSYSVDDKDKLYNSLSSKWVKPSHLSSSAIPVYEELGLTNRFIFESYDELTRVDMYEQNDFRVIMNLNPMVDVSQVSLGLVSNSGEGYAENNTGLCIVGGSSFTYTVLSVDENGGVLTLSLTPDEHVTEIPLMNFDFEENVPNVYTSYYGTSRIDGNGKGLKFSFRIDSDHLDSILPYKGEFFRDLFALVRENDGLFIYTYEIDTTSEMVPKPGHWVKGMKISEFEITSTDKQSGGIATQESFINSIIPNLETLPVTHASDNENMTSLKVMQTANCITVIDTDHTPVIPKNVSDDNIPSNVVDLCKFYCDGISQTVADDKTPTGVIDALTRHNKLRYDSYVIWRWADAVDPSNKIFEYGIISRGFNNYFTTDIKTKLPTNQLNCDNFVHFNPSTTIVWTVPGVGPMIWVYDPLSTIKETYRIDSETMDLEVIRNTYTYANIDVRNSNTNEVIKIVEDGKYLWNIMSNNPQNVPFTPESTDPLYQNPPMTQFTEVVVGASVSSTSPLHQLSGNWKLAFPKISSYRLSDDVTETHFIPKKLEVIKGRNINVQNTTKVFDEYGNDVSTKTLLIEEGSDSTRMKIYNSNMSRWDDV